MSSPDLLKAHPRRGDYGFDAPYVPIGMGIGAVVAFALAALAGAQGHRGPVISFGITGVVLVLSASSYLYTTRAGKFVAWDRLLSELPLQGDERGLDIGCGRGAVLHLLAERLPRGRAVGIDLWQTRDQSGNALEVTRTNARLEGVEECVELHTGDMRALPFPDGSFDLVVSSLAIHNVPDGPDRAKAVQEAARVLKPGGRILLADFRFTGDYARELTRAGLSNVTSRSLGWRFWYGGPWTATTVVSGVRPR